MSRSWRVSRGRHEAFARLNRGRRRWNNNGACLSRGAGTDCVVFPDVKIGRETVSGAVSRVLFAISADTAALPKRSGAGIAVSSARDSVRTRNRAGFLCQPCAKRGRNEADGGGGAETRGAGNP